MPKEKTSTGVEVVEERAGEKVRFENVSASPMIPQAKRFYTVHDIMRELDCSESYAYKQMRTVNDSLKARGLMTFRGRVLRRAWIEATGAE